MTIHNLSRGQQIALSGVAVLLVAVLALLSMFYSARLQTNVIGYDPSPSPDLLAEEAGILYAINNPTISLYPGVTNPEALEGVELGPDVSVPPTSETPYIQLTFAIPHSAYMPEADSGQRFEVREVPELVVEGVAYASFFTSLDPDRDFARMPDGRDVLDTTLEDGEGASPVVSIFKIRGLSWHINTGDTYSFRGIIHDRITQRDYLVERNITMTLLPQENEGANEGNEEEEENTEDISNEEEEECTCNNAE